MGAPAWTSPSGDEIGPKSVHNLTWKIISRGGPQVTQISRGQISRGCNFDFKTDTNLTWTNLMWTPLLKVQCRFFCGFTHVGKSHVGWQSRCHQLADGLVGGIGGWGTQAEGDLQAFNGSCSFQTLLTLEQRSSRVSPTVAKHASFAFGCCMIMVRGQSLNISCFTTQQVIDAVMMCI